MSAMASWVHEAQAKIESLSIPEPNSGCWLWEGGVLREKKPYGRTSFQKRPWAAHRLSYAAFNGPIPSTLWVLHRCDNPACVNPDHLFLGTGDDNVADRGAKGRTAHGSGHPNARFTPDEIRAIRASKKSYRALGREYGIDNCAIRSICLGKSYKDVV